MMNDAEDTHPPLPPRRRAADPSIDHLHDCVEGLKGQMNTLAGQVATAVAKQAEIAKQLEDNTVTTNEVRDILKSFALFGRFAKWFSYVAGGIGAGLALVKQLKGG